MNRQTNIFSSIFGNKYRVRLQKYACRKENNVMKKRKNDFIARVHLFIEKVPRKIKICYFPMIEWAEFNFPTLNMRNSLFILYRARFFFVENEAEH